MENELATWHAHNTVKRFQGFLIFRPINSLICLYYALYLNFLTQKNPPASCRGIIEAIFRRETDIEIHSGIWTQSRALALKGWQLSRMISSFHILLAWRRKKERVIYYMARVLRRLCKGKSELDDKCEPKEKGVAVISYDQFLPYLPHLMKGKRKLL